MAITKKKLLIYSDCYIFGGSEGVIENILRSDILNNEFNISFYYAFCPDYDQKVKEKLGNLRDRTISPIYILGDSWYRYKFRQQAKYTFNFYFYGGMSILFSALRVFGILSLFNFFKLKYLFSKSKTQIILINNGGYPGGLSCRIAAVAAHQAGIKNTYFVVNNMALPSRNLFDTYLDKLVDKSVSKFITASKAAKDRLIKTRGFDQNKCLNIANTLYAENETSLIKLGLLRKEFSIDTNKIVIVSTGILTERKGFHILIDAIQLLKEKQTDLLKKIVVFIFGEGEDRGLLEKKINTHALEKNIFLPGYRTNILSYVIDCDIFILPSTKNEDFPYVNIEAMLLKKPIISTAVAGIPEQIDDTKTGYIVEPNDAKSLMQKIAQVIMMTEEERKLMGEKAYQKYTSSFSYNHIMEQYDHLFSLNF